MQCDEAAHGLDKATRDGQSKPGTIGSFGARSTFEAFEDACVVLGGDAGANR